MLRTDFEFGLPRAINRPRNDKRGRLLCHCEASAHTGCGNLVQELPNSYKPVRLHRPPLRGTARRGRLRSRWRRRSLTDAAYPLRVRALRIVCRTLAVGAAISRPVQALPL